MIGLAAFEHSRRQAARAAMLRALLARARPSFDLPSPWVEHAPVRVTVVTARGGRIVRWMQPGQVFGNLHFPSECYVRFAPGCRISVPMPLSAALHNGVAALVELDLPDGAELHTYDDEGFPIYRMPKRASHWRQISILPFPFPRPVPTL